MVLGLVVFAVSLAAGAPLWAAIGGGAVVTAVLVSTARYRRRERERRAAEHAARRAMRKAGRRDRRRATIRRRTGLDVALLAQAASDAIYAVGTKITKRLESRYAAAEPTRRGGWLDLDSDFETMRSQALTDEALRLNDELRHSRHAGNRR